MQHKTRLIPLYLLFLPLLLLSNPKPVPGAEEASPLPPLENFLTRSTIQKLKTRGNISRYSMESGEIQLVPACRLADTLLAEAAELEPWVVTEGLFLLDDASVRAEIPGGDPDLVYYNTLRSVSTMRGIDYYSASEDEYQPFIEDAYYIDSPDSRAPLPDPHFEEIPRRDSAWGFQNDTTFGKEVYRLKYWYDGQAILQTSVNHSKLRYYLVSLADGGNMMTLSLLIPTREGLLFYGAAVGNPNRFLGIKIDKSDSLYNRMSAVKEWFCRQTGIPHQRTRMNNR